MANRALFDDCLESLDKWEVACGEWEAAGGVLRGTGRPDSLILAGDERWDDSRAGATMRAVRSTIPEVDYVKCFLVFRAEDEANHYRVGVYGGDQNKAIHLERKVDGQVWNLGYWRFDDPALKSEIKLGDWITLEAEASGARLRAYLNGMLIIEAEDDAFGCGRIGVGADEGMAIECKDVAVRSVERVPGRAKASPLKLRIIQRNLMHRDILVRLKVGRMLDLRPETLQAKIRIVSMGERRLAASRVVKGFGENRRLEVRFDTRGYAPGEYRADVQLQDEDGRILSSRSGGFRVLPEPGWLGSRAGVTDEVLAPWTPLEVEDQTVRCLGRAYEFTRSLFPARIETAGKSVLSSPIGLGGRVNGMPLCCGPCAAAVTSASEAQVVLEASAEANGSRLATRTLVEYDGMIRVDLSVHPKAEATIEELVLRVPLRREYATLYHFWPRGAGKTGRLNPVTRNSGALPPEGLQLPFKPYVWLGDEEGGVGWFAESDEGWRNESERKKITVTVAAEEVVLNVILIDRPTRITGPVRFTLGFQATPLKPFPEDWRTWKICHGAFYGMEKGTRSLLAQLRQRGAGAIVYHENWTDLENYSDTPYREDLSSLVQAVHEQGMKLLLYFGFLLSDIAPEFGPYHEELISKAPGQDVALPPVTDWTHDMPPQRWNYVVCYNSPWQDFLVEAIRRLVEEEGVDGVYLDGTMEPYACRNTLHGCGYRDEAGSLHHTYPIFAVRALMKRIYAICTRNGGLVNVHQSSCMVSPTLAFSTSYWDGEHLSQGLIQKAVRKAGRTSAYLEVLPPAMFRAEFMGKNWGVPSQYLAYTSGRYEAEGWNDDAALALCLLHDTMMRPCVSRAGAGRPPHVDSSAECLFRIWRVMEEFGVGLRECEWRPYWRRNRLVRSKPGGVEISAYEIAGKRALLVVSNLTDEAKRGALVLDMSRLGPAGSVRARDGMSGDTVVIGPDGAIATDLDPFRWRLLLVERAAE